MPAKHASKRNAILKRIAAVVVVALALWFAVQGGEFSTADLIRQRQRRARLAKQVDSLQHQVDSLRKYENLVLHDPKTQERIAREVFGMVRGDKEIVYRFAEPRDTVRDTVGSRARKAP
jgi:cell division protein FtsB